MSDDDWKRQQFLEGRGKPICPAQEFFNRQHEIWSLGDGGDSVWTTHLDALLPHSADRNDAVDWTELTQTIPYPVNCFDKRIAPPFEPPKSKAGDEPQKPQTDAFRVMSEGIEKLAPFLLGRARRRSARQVYEIAMDDWRDEHARWQRLQNLDEVENAKYEQEKTSYEKFAEKASDEDDEQIALWEEHRSTWEKENRDCIVWAEKMRNGYEAGENDGIKDYFSYVLRRSEYPASFPRQTDLEFDDVSRVIVIEMQLPNILEIPVMRSDARGKVREVAPRDRKKYHEAVQYAVALRTLHEVAESDAAQQVDSVCFNGWLSYVDPIDGHRKSAWVISVLAEAGKIRAINIGGVGPKEAFEALKGRASPTMVDINPVPPILQINREDRRVVESNFSMDDMESSTNLAAMHWEKFEHLVRELFSFEFSREGAEVKVTQASRDGGVDAIAWDPDPIRGGKFVIQAKRYTNVVGVSAVRDLYGTVVNEGASRGILVTTSRYGADAANFAKDKPLTLLDGNDLLGLLKKHGYDFHIDIKEARRLAQQ